jgi:hypothetical protein
VALAFADGPRTLYEAAKALGKPTGSIYGLVQRMLADELLLADSDPPVRGTMYELNPAFREALEHSAQGDHIPGVLVRNQRTLTISGGPDRMTAMEILARPTLSGAVAWTARTDSGSGMLLAMATDAEDVQVDRLYAALTKAGFSCQEGVIGQVTTAAEIRAHAIAMREAAEEVVR